MVKFKGISILLIPYVILCVNWTTTFSFPINLFNRSVVLVTEVYGNNRVFSNVLSVGKNFSKIPDDFYVYFFVAINLALHSKGGLHFDLCQ